MYIEKECMSTDTRGPCSVARRFLDCVMSKADSKKGPTSGSYD